MSSSRSCASGVGRALRGLRPGGDPSPRGVGAGPPDSLSHSSGHRVLFPARWGHTDRSLPALSFQEGRWMLRTLRCGSPVARVARVVPVLLLLSLVAAVAAPAAASRPAEVIVLPGASSAEGIAAGRGATFYAGDLFAGDIFRGNVRRGTAELFIDAPAGRMAVGMAADLRHDLLLWPVASPARAMCTTSGPVPPWPATSSRPTGHRHQRRGRHPPRRLVHRFHKASSTSCRSAGPIRGCPPWISAVRRPTPAGSSTSTASRPPPTARP